MPARTLVVVNPKSRHGAVGRRWAAVEAKLRAALGAGLEVEHTRGPRDAERIAREGVRAGVERIVIAGGDGTASEVVTGLLAADLGGYAQIGLLPVGTGGDLPRALGIPRDLDVAIERLARGKARRIDAGRVRYRAPDAREAQVYFLNIASLGIGGLVSMLVNRAPKVLGGTASFLLGTLRAIASYRSPDVAIRLDGDLVYEGPILFATAANGQYFGGGMHVAPEASIDDGLLDVVLVRYVSKRRLYANLPRIYRGTHLRLPEVRCLRGRRLEADAPSGEVWIEVDGEALGTLPVVFEVVPGAISVIGTEG